MRADVYSLDEILGQRQQWVVPVYQRHYEWETVPEDRQIPEFWHDLKEKATENLDGRDSFPHYFGAIILFQPPETQRLGAVPQHLLVDGQQRITTFQLTLVAIREVARDHKISDTLDTVYSYIYNEKSRSKVNPDHECFKLWPSSYDRALYQDIIGNNYDELRNLQKRYFHKNGNLKKGGAPNLIRAFCYLYESIKVFVEERQEYGQNPEDVLDALLKSFLFGFRIVVIQLDKDDSAQEIFASLNGLAKPLSPFDLIRNDVFHRAQKIGEDAQKLFGDLWEPFENPFWSEQVRKGRLKRARADHLITHAVISETARDVNVGKIATEYKRYVEERDFPTIAEELQILRQHAETYRSMEEQDEKAVFAEVANVLRIWDMSTFYPLILWINSQLLKDQDKKKLFRGVESYLVRREICGLTHKSYNKVVPGIIRHLKGRNDIVSAFFNHISSMTGDVSRMPADMEVKEKIRDRKIYGVVPTPRIRYILHRIENEKRGTFDEVPDAPFEKLTIEHVMPRSWAKHWSLSDGKVVPCESTLEAASSGHVLDDKTKTLMDERQQVLDTLGNLTLLTKSLNPSIGNEAWETKHDYLSKSLLALNREIADNKFWDETVIKKRAENLATVANSIWKSQGN